MTLPANAARRAVLERLFAEAVALPPHERGAWLARVTGSDASMRDELSSLLAAYDASDGWLEGLAGDVVAPVLHAIASEEPSSMDVRLAPGTRVGRYEVLDFVGRGGMGMVYHARDTALDRPVALKFLAPGPEGETRGRARLLDEARAASALDHPNIAVIHEIGALESGWPFLAMAWCEGETLAARLGRGALAVDEAVRIAVQLADALSAAHEAGIVHRDVKPANVMLGRTGVPKLLDFGISTRIGGEGECGETTPMASGTSSTPGTLAYMSPEQERGDVVDARTDIWSLGVVLFEMLVGERPFTGDSSAVREALRTRPAPSLSVERADLPKALVAIVARCLEQEPAARWPSAASLRDALSALDDGATSRTWSATTPRVRPWLIAGSTLLVGAALVTWMRTVTARHDATLTTRIAARPLLVAAVTSSDGTPAPRDAATALLADAARSAVTEADGTALATDSLVQAVLVRMRRLPGTTLVPGIAREIAEREGLSGVVEPSVTRAGRRRVLSLRLVTPEGTELASVREESADDVPTLAVVERLAARFRVAMTVPLSQTPRRAPLARVTTASLEALRVHARMREVWTIEGDQSLSLALLRQAVSLDSAFVDAWRRIAIANAAAGGPVAVSRQAVEQAWRFRGLVSDGERFQAEAAYFATIHRDRARTISAQEAAMRCCASVPTFNLVGHYISRREFAQAEAALLRIIADGDSSFVLLRTLVEVRVNQGKRAAADSILVIAQRREPVRAQADLVVPMMLAQGDLDGAERVLDSIASTAVVRATRSRAWATLATVHTLRGRLGQASEAHRRWRESRLAAGGIVDTLYERLVTAHDRLRLGLDPAEGRPAFTAWLGALDLSAIPAVGSAHGVPYALLVAGAWSAIGQPAAARRALAFFERDDREPALRTSHAALLENVRAEAFIAGGAGRLAVEAFRRGDRLPDGPATDCTICLHRNVARAWDAAGEPDSARVAYARYLETPQFRRLELDAIDLVPALVRLGTLFESRGDVVKARDMWSRVVEVWQDADAPLQPTVSRARARLRVLELRAAGGS